jgi:hypothetical protein
MYKVRKRNNHMSYPQCTGCLQDRWELKTQFITRQITVGYFPLLRVLEKLAMVDVLGQWPVKVRTYDMDK